VPEKYQERDDMHTSIKSGKLKASMVLVGLAITGSVSAQSFPSKPVEMTILFGSTAQTIGQVLADQMSKNLPQPVVPVSRPGGGGATGYIHVQAQAADGYNIVWNSNSINTSYHSGKIKFDYKAFTPIARISEEPVAVAVRTDSGWSSLKDVAEAVKSGKTKLRVGASGKGSFTHMTTHSIFASLGIQDRIISVPYDGGKAPLELLADRVDLAVQWPGQFVSHAKAGTLKILCVSGGKRSSHLPDVPTCDESGAKGVDLTMWRGLAAPAGTPTDAIAKLEAAAKAATESAEFKSAAEKIGFEIEFLPAKAFGDVIASDDKKFESLMKEIGLKK
jgi:tripartite-type tricarboxylate transporter receptor subunit TctC